MITCDGIGVYFMKDGDGEQHCLYGMWVWYILRGEGTVEGISIYSEWQW